ncbi:MAG: pyridoxine 5'-phosphate synthase [Desulfuromonadaceae bacterium]|nr:pyridoxine 5'-phosphate synthase [Desulfuromonadaceae bacterium]
MMQARLGVNIDHVATIRQARGGTEPDPVAAAVIAELAGADGITVHLREDRRHIQDRDVRILREILQTPLNLEMAATVEMVDIACRIRPYCVTLVPEKRQELTTEGGLDVVKQAESLKTSIELLQQTGIRVSLFVDPDPIQIERAAALKAEAIEIHTGTYCNATLGQKRQTELEGIAAAISLGRSSGLQVNAGHGLNYQNVQAVVALGGIAEYNIGHSIISRAVLVGLERAVREMKTLLQMPER